jgi:hypothetical protein
METRNECYPAAPPVPFGAEPEVCDVRRAFMDRRNAGVQAVGAGRAVAAAGGDSIGKGKPKTGAV